MSRGKARLTPGLRGEWDEYGGSRDPTGLPPQPSGPSPAPSTPFPSPSLTQMTKDLSYGGSKNQHFLLAFSFVASRNPCSFRFPSRPQAGSPPQLKVLF